jgi:hypothetical protein
MRVNALRELSRISSAAFCVFPALGLATGKWMEVGEIPSNYGRLSFLYLNQNKYYGDAVASVLNSL